MPSEHRYIREIDRLFEEGTILGLDENALLARAVSSRDQPALEALVERHGPMVLGVCRRLLANPHDVDDAFQATFLILVRRARALGDRHRLGPWLHGVAYRVAARARSDAARRRALEQSAAKPECGTVAEAPDRLVARNEQCVVVDQEIAQLPAAQRSVIVLVDLEGQSQRSAARRLGWSEDAVRGRLARARAALRKRLIRRGVAPAVLPLAGPALEHALPPVVSPALLESTTRAGIATLLAGRAAPSATTVISASALALARNVTRAMTVSRAALLALAFLTIAAGIVMIGLVRAGVSASVVEQQKPAAAPAIERSQTAEKSHSQSLEVRLVSRSSKQPIAGAAVDVSFWRDSSQHEQSGSTDVQGSCRFELPHDITSLSIFAAKDGFVPIRIDWPQDKVSQGLPPTCVRELEPGFPMGGFVKDEEGQPVADAEVRVALDRRKTMEPDIDLPQGANSSIYAGFPSIVVKTDEKGRWRCSALPEDAEQTTRLWFFVSHRDHVSDSRGYSRRLSLKTARAMTEAFVVRSGVQIGGQAHDAHGKAVPGATVVLAYSANTGDFLRTKTDQAGRFMFAHVDDETPMGRFCLSVEAVGFSPAWKMLVPRDAIPVLDFELAPGRPFSGQVVDSRGAPVAGAQVEPRWQECHVFDWKATTDSEGRFLWLSAPTNGEIEFRVRKTGFLMAIQRLAAAQAAAIKITLNREIRIQGSVTDAKSGQPIPAFKVIEGETVANGRIFWRGDGKAAQNGRFEVAPFIYDRPGVAFFVQITAEGYRPSVSRAIIPGERDVVVDVKLEKGKGPSGLVKLPDGSPAEGADVYLNSPKYGLPIENNRQSFLSLGADSHWLKTDAQGRFAFTPKDEPFGVFVLHHKGVAQKSASELEQSSTLTLEPFGRIEGNLRIGPAPGVRQPIRVSLNRTRYASDHQFQFFEYTATTDDQGRFTIEDVMPGEAVVIHEAPGPSTRRVYLTSATPVDVVGGHTARVEFGGQGRPVIGRIAVPAGSARKFDLAVGSGVLRLDQPSMRLPDGFMSWDRAKRYAYSKRWSLSPEGRAHRRAGRLHMFSIAADGSFRMDDVLPGSYKLSIHLGDPPALAGGRAGSHASARFERILEVETIPGGRTDTPLDLGSLQLSVEVPGKSPVSVGDIAPAFEIKTLDGNPLKLADFKGKFVLLDFWATWCGPCLEQEPHLREVHEAFAGDSRLVMISLSLDDNPEIARGHVLKEKLPWTHAFLGRDSDVTGNYGIASIPHVLLIGPDGRVLTRDLGGAGIRSAVIQALDRPR
jgi:RNA polymerase sigma factor (sigma-70 family)